MPSPLIYPKFQAINPTIVGAAAAGFKLKTFAAGTATPLATYTDATLAVANPTTILMDAFGEANVWLGQLAYKFVFTDAADVVIWTVDNVTQASLGQLQSEWVALPTPTFINATNLSISGVTDLTASPYFIARGTRIKTVNSGGTIYSTVDTVAGNQLGVRNDSGVLDAGLSSAAYGIIAGQNTSIAAKTYIGYIGGANVALVNGVATGINSGGTLVIDKIGESTVTAQVTVKFAGIYRIFGHILFNEQAGTNNIANFPQTVQVRKNGVAAFTTTINWAVANLTASTQAIPFHGTVALVVNDFIDVAVVAAFAAVAPTAGLAAFTLERIN